MTVWVARMPTEPETRLDASPGLLALARERMRTRHLARRTEQAYLQWLERYVAFHHGRHPRTLGAAEVEQFLTHLAVHRTVSAATQSQARQALLFIYRHVLQGTPWLVAGLLYGAGLRLMEAMRLRVKDLAVERGEVIVREGKGGKDRVTMLHTADGESCARASAAHLTCKGRRDPPLSECGAARPAAARHTRGPGRGSAPVRGCAPAKPFCRHAS